MLPPTKKAKILYSVMASAMAGFTVAVQVCPPPLLLPYLLYLIRNRSTVQTVILICKARRLLTLKHSSRSCINESISDLQSPSGTSAPAIAPISSNQDDNSSIDSPPVSRQNRVHNHHMPTSASPRSAPSKPPKPSLQRTRADRKFNLVVYGVREQPKGSQRHIRSAQDEETITLILSCVHSPITEYSVSDCFRLGKYSENWCRPVLTTLSRSNDVISVLANRLHLSHSSQYPHLSIKPDLTPEARKVESILLKQRRELITSGTNPRDIKIRRDTLLINSRKHGVVVDSTVQLCPLFQLCPLRSDHVNAAFLSSQPNQSIITASVSTPVTSSQPINTATTETPTTETTTAPYTLTPLSAALTVPHPVLHSTMKTLSILSTLYLTPHISSSWVINPRRACAERVTVVVLCVYVCVCVCLSAHAILAVRMIKSVTKDNVRFAAIL